MQLKDGEHGEKHLEINLTDWQVCGGDAPKEGSPSEIQGKIIISGDKVYVIFDENDADKRREVAIELEDGNVQVRHYSPAKDTPMKVTIPPSGEIAVDDHDYCKEEAREDEVQPAAAP